MYHVPADLGFHVTWASDVQMDSLSPNLDLRKHRSECRGAVGDRGLIEPWTMDSSVCTLACICECEKGVSLVL